MEASNSKLKRVMSRLDTRTETVVGFDDDARRLVEQLMGGKKQLQIMSVVGMAGIGKTTLVKKVFNEPSVLYHFHVRAWTSVTQEPKKRDLLLAILKTGFNAAEFENCSDMELSETLKRRLSGQRYMVVMDDIWEGKDWDDLMLCFPDDNMGSRILFTSRIADMSLLVQPGRYQHPLRLLTEKESWDLLRYKVFLKQTCPQSLIEIGVQIARKCHGLPLSIVVIAGILATEMTTNWWSYVAQDMSSMASNAPEQYIETLVLSYNHLPDHLKPCFLYFTAFPEDCEIPAWKLIMLWVAEGFIKIQPTENDLEEEDGNNLENVATNYLKDLISRSMVIVSQRRSDGGIKACIIHDALRDLCIKKAEELKFMYQLPSYQQNGSKLENSTTSMVQRLYSREIVEVNLLLQLQRYSNFHPSTEMVHKLCPSSSKWTENVTLFPDVQCILCCNQSGSFAKVRYWKGRPNLHFDVLMVFKSLKVLDLSGIELSNIPIIIESLLELRYIAVCAKAPDENTTHRPTLTFPPSIHGLKNLETLIVYNRNRYEFLVYGEVWMLYRLRHLILKGNFKRLYPPEYIETLSHLQSLAFPVAVRHYEKILKCTPNLQKLRINEALYLSSTELVVPGLNTLKRLENLSLQNDIGAWVPLNHMLPVREFSRPSMFPATLKKLTLVCTFLKWTEMETIGMLPNLEVLKLQCEAFRGEHWETNDDGFRRLKYLAFKYMKIVQWSAYSEQFPNLEHLKLDECLQLEEIPIGIGDIYTLEMIEIRNCSAAVMKSAREIKEDQVNKGNDMLKISIFQT